MILAIQVEHMKKCVIKPFLHDAPIFFPPRKKSINTLNSLMTTYLLWLYITTQISNTSIQIIRRWHDVQSTDFQLYFSSNAYNGCLWSNNITSTREAYYSCNRRLKMSGKKQGRKWLILFYFKILFYLFFLHIFSEKLTFSPPSP